MNKEDILKKASKCSTCITKPCQVGCPLNNDTTEFIRLAKLEEFEKACGRDFQVPAVRTDVL